MAGFLLYGLIYLAAAVPGLPAGWRLFGRRHPAGWVAGALLGYALTAVAIWVVIRAGVPSPLAFLASWLATTALAWFVVGLRKEPLVPLAEWRRRDSIAYALVLLLTVVIAAPPFLKLGSRDDAGNQYYRAYFTADFVWHTALAAEIGKFSMPPRNPFLRNRNIHYYWGYFLLPAAVAAEGPSPVADVERCLKLNAFFSGLLFISAIFMSVRAAVPNAAAAGTAVALALAASSAEGLAEVVRLWWHDLPLAGLRETNIDAITAWRWQGYRVDGLQRAIWYNPQHSMSGALGLIGLAAAAGGGSAATLSSGLLAGTALAASVAMNPFVGAMFSMAYGAGAAFHALVNGGGLRRLVNSAAAVIPVVLALAWCVANEMVEGAGGAMDFGFHSISRHWPVQTLLLSLGPALLPAAAGLFVRGAGSVAPLVPAATLAAASVFLMYYARIAVDEYWVGFRTGHLLLVSLPALAARFFVWAYARARAAAAAMIAVVLVAGLPTLLIDAYNAQDIRNFEMSVGAFPWTRVVTPDQQAAWRWIREETPPEAVVQQDSLSRHPSSWWVVPTFGQRRMAAAIPPFMIYVDEYREKSERVRQVYATGDAREAWTEARALRIDYVYIDEVERAAYGGSLEKFNDERYFSVAFQNAAVTIYALK